MRVAYIPEMAALLSAHAATIRSEPQRLTDDVLGEVFLACRNRTNHWLQDIDRFSGMEGISSESLLARRHPLVELTERVLANDILVRVWAALVISVDRHGAPGQAEPIARNVHVAQMIVRHRALTRLLDASGPSSDEVRHLNRVREKSERWTDMLIGHLGDESVIEDFVFDRKRARDFASGRSPRPSKPSHHVWQLILAGIRTAFEQDLPATSILSQADRDVVKAMIAGISPTITRFTDSNGRLLTHQVNPSTQSN